MKRISERLSPATVLAALALLVALGGTSVAAVTAVLPASSVGTTQLKANAVTSAKVKNGSLLRVDFKSGQIPAGARGAVGPAGAAGPAGPAGPTGPAGAAGAGGAGATTAWAHVASNGVVISSSSGVSLAAHPSPGVYYLNFGSAINGKLILAAPSQAAGDTAGKGGVIANPCGTATEGPPCPAAQNTTSFVQVFTQNAANTADVDHSFYVAVFG